MACPGSAGGALLVVLAFATLHNSTIWSFRPQVTLAASGGAVSVVHSSASTIDDGTPEPVGAWVVLNRTVVHGCRAANGGGIHARNALVSFTGSALSACTASEFGGCMYAEVSAVAVEYPLSTAR